MKLPQLISLVVFGALCVIGVLVFALSSVPNQSETANNAPFSVWGTMPQDFGEQIVKAYSELNNAQITYKYVPVDIFEQSLVNEIATGEPPALVLVPHEYLFGKDDLFYTLSYEFFSERAFRDTYVNVADILLTPAGIVGYPLAVDPVVMFWNTDIFATSGIAKPPALWSEFVALNGKITKRNDAGGFERMLISFGESGNVLNLREVLSSLFLQTGDKIVSLGIDGRQDIKFGTNGQAASALRFFSDFSDPNKSTYSWNSAQANSINAFSSGDVAVYIGAFSDIARIKELNPNLRFDISPIPQIPETPRPNTYGSVFAFGVIKKSPAINSALNAAMGISTNQSISAYVTRYNLAPALRSVLANKPKDRFSPVLFDSAIISETWFDTNPKETREIFMGMVEKINLGSMSPEQAISNARNFFVERMR